MIKKKVYIVDYGMCNIMSVYRSFISIGAEVIVTSDPDLIIRAERIILPGVGAFKNAIVELNNQNLTSAIKEVANKGSLILGICLGMQLLFDESTEFGLTKGLSLIPGKVIPIPNKSKENKRIVIPHIGWNALIEEPSFKGLRKNFLKDLKKNSEVYFIHSFMAEAKNCVIANCNYEGITIPAIVAKENIFGCQFHPEKSGLIGRTILKNFLNLNS